MSNNVNVPSASVKLDETLEALRQLFPQADIMIMSGLFDGEVSGVLLDEDEEAVLAEELGPGTHLIISLGDMPHEAGFHMAE